MMDEESKEKRGFQDPRSVEQVDDPSLERRDKEKRENNVRKQVKK